MNIQRSKDWWIERLRGEPDLPVSAGIPDADPRPQAFASSFKPTIWHRLGFGHAYVAPWAEDEDHNGRCPDGLLATSLVTDTHVHFDFVDRLRLLVTGRLHVHVRTRSENDPGKSESRSSVKVKGWGWR